MDPNLDKNDYDLIIDLNPTNFDVEGVIDCTTTFATDHVRFFNIKNSGVVDNGDYFCNNPDGSPPFNTDLEAVAKNRDEKCITVFWTVYNDNYTGAGFAFEFSSKFKFECFINVVN